MNKQSMEKQAKYKKQKILQKSINNKQKTLDQGESSVILNITKAFL